MPKTARNGAPVLSHGAWQLTRSTGFPIKDLSESGARAAAKLQVHSARVVMPAGRIEYPANPMVAGRASWNAAS